MATTAPRSRRFFADKDRAFWILQSLGWAGYFVLRTLTGIANTMGLLFIVPTALNTATGFCLSCLMAQAFRYLFNRKPAVTWTSSILIVIVASACFSIIEVFAYSVFFRPGSRPEGVQFFGAILLDFSLLAAWSALYYGINLYLVVERQAEQLVQLEAQASSAQLAMLRYQLNPHFLFNTLNSISTLVLLKQTDRANAMLSRLSSFLRYTLVNEPASQVTVAQEMETLKLYLEIEKMRFEDRLRPAFTVDPRVVKARMPSLLLQPLVENAIKYAVTPQEDGADIAIDARLAGDRVQITVSDSGPGLNDAAPRINYPEGTGVGLPNIRDRLNQAYDGNHRFETHSSPGGGFSVLIDIPYQSEHTKEPA